jgi:hypothetical protein
MQSNKKRKNNYPSLVDKIDSKSYKISSSIKEIINLNIKDEFNQKKYLSTKLSSKKYEVNQGIFADDDDDLLPE